MNPEPALMLIDIQNDYFPDGRNPLHQPEQAARQAQALLSLFRTRGLPVIHVKHINIKPGSTFFLPCHPHGHAIRDLVAPIAGEPVVVKHFPDSFLRTDLQHRLRERKIKNLVIAGMMTHMCVDTTVRSAKAKGYTITVVADACATKDLAWNGQTIPADTVHAAYMAGLHGTFATITNLNDYQMGLDDPA